MGKREDALVVLQWLPQGFNGGPPIPYRLQGSDPIVHPDELPQIIENMRSMRPWYEGLPRSVPRATAPVPSSVRPLDTSGTVVGDGGLF